MAGENIMPYIYVLELLRYRQLKIATNFFECIFRSYQKNCNVYTITEMAGKVARSTPTKLETIFSNRYSLNLKLHIRLQSIPLKSLCFYLDVDIHDSISSKT